MNAFIPDRPDDEFMDHPDHPDHEEWLINKEAEDRKRETFFPYNQMESLQGKKGWFL